MNEREQFAADYNALEDAMQEAGFSREQTGGGCEAWTRTTGTDTIFVTTLLDPTVPLSLAEPCVVTVCARDDRILHKREYPSTAEALADWSVTL